MTAARARSAQRRRREGIVASGGWGQNRTSLSSYRVRRGGGQARSAIFLVCSEPRSRVFQEADPPKRVTTNKNMSSITELLEVCRSRPPRVGFILGSGLSG